MALYICQAFEESNLTVPLALSRGSMVCVVFIFAKAVTIGYRMTERYKLRKKSSRLSLFQVFFITTVLELTILLICLFINLNVFINGKKARIDYKTVEGSSRNIPFAILFSMGFIIDTCFTVITFKFYKWDDK